VSYKALCLRTLNAHMHVWSLDVLHNTCMLVCPLVFCHRRLQTGICQMPHKRRVASHNTHTVSLSIWGAAVGTCTIVQGHIQPYTHTHVHLCRASSLGMFHAFVAFCSQLRPLQSRADAACKQGFSSTGLFVVPITGLSGVLSIRLFGALALFKRYSCVQIFLQFYISPASA
jgi:hypothetical protein